MTNDELTAAIVEAITRIALSKSSTLLIGISGLDCAGKSTLAIAVDRQLASRGFNTRIISIDDFLVPLTLKERRAPEFMGYFEDAFDYAGLIRALESATESNPEAFANVVLVEGVFLLRQELRHWWDFTIWLEIDSTLALDRALTRDSAHFGDAATVRRIYEARCHPAQAYHESRDEPRAHAHFIARFEAGAWSLHVNGNGG